MTIPQPITVLDSFPRRSFFRMPVHRALSLAFPLLSIFFFMQRTARAHNLVVFAWVEGDGVVVRAHFGKRTRPAKHCQVKVFGPGRELMMELKTDGHGECRFRPTQMVDLTIRVNAGDGHAKEFKLPKSELDALLPADSDNPENQIPSGGSIETTPANGTESSGETGIGVASDENPSTASMGENSSGQDLARIRKELKSMRVVLSKIQEDLADMKAPPGVQPQDIINGLCVILGMTGIATLTLYWQKTRKGKSN